jgi:hypothetical protein
MRAGTFGTSIFGNGRKEVTTPIERLRAMTEDKGGTWDLSPTDVAAIHWALVRIRQLEADAARYLWLKSRKALMLRSEPLRWQRLDGTAFYSTHYMADDITQYAPAESLDAMIDGAMAACTSLDPEKP